jgi:hypothetical protein
LNNIHIPKTIHISWKTKDILEVDHIFPQNTIQKLVSLAEGWTPVVSDDIDVEKYLKSNLSIVDYYLLHDRDIVEKLDVWRLLKLYNEGGLYTDIDRLCNTSINSIIKDDTKLVLPEYENTDFSQDFMCSAPNNPIFLETLNINLQRRKMGIKDIYLLGPQTYFHGVTKIMTGEMVQVNPDNETFQQLRDIIHKTGFIVTYKENPPYKTIMYQPENKQIDFDHVEEKKNFYLQNGISHWTRVW